MFPGRNGVLARENDSPLSIIFVGRRKRIDAQSSIQGRYAPTACHLAGPLEKDIIRNPFATIFSLFGRQWNGSLKFRLVLLGLVPLVVVFPLVIGVVLVAGGQRADALIAAQVRGNLAGARNYLDVIKSDTLQRVTELSRSDHLTELMRSGVSRSALDQTLAVAARGSGLDYLVVASADGRVLGSSSGIAALRVLPDSYVIRQAQLGLTSVGVERFDPEGLRSFSPRFVELARVGPDAGLAQQAPDDDSALEARGLLINAAAHLPLSIKADDAILVGGIILNNNSALIGHMREVIFPVGSLPEDTEGMTAIYLDSTGIAVTRQRHVPNPLTGIAAPAGALDGVTASGDVWLGAQPVSGVNYLMGFAPLFNGDGERIGMVAAGFPDAPYQRQTWTVLAMVIALMGISLALISVVFLRAGQWMTGVLNGVSLVMTRFLQGDRNARVGPQRHHDAVAVLTQGLDTLLDTITRQELAQQQAQKAISDEASRWRALFLQERDAVVVLDDQGRVLEANPQFGLMLGYDASEPSQLQVSDWDERFAPGDFARFIGQLHRDGLEFETTHRRKDGTRYAAAVSVSLAHWSDRTFVMMSMRDITARRESERQLRLAANVFDHTSEAILVTDADRRVLKVNFAFERVTGYARGDVIGTLFPTARTTERNPGLVVELFKSLECSASWSGEIIAVRKSGETYPARLNVSMVRDERGQLLHLVVLFSDITIEVGHRQRLEQFALYDSLTQLPNRRLLAERFRLAQSTSVRAGQYGALMMLDLDSFKALNDAHGHAAGDLFLIEVAQRIKRCLRETDTVARLGGDEFVILLSGLSPRGGVAQSDARAFAEKVRAALEQPYILREVPGIESGVVIEHHGSASIGVVLFWGNEETLEQLQAKADEAMFLVKARGRNGVCFRDGERWPDRGAACGQ